MKSKGKKYALKPAKPTPIIRLIWQIESLAGFQSRLNLFSPPLESSMRGELTSADVDRVRELYKQEWSPDYQKCLAELHKLIPPVLKIYQRAKVDATAMYRYWADISVLRQRGPTEHMDILASLYNLMLQTWNGIPKPRTMNFQLSAESNGEGHIAILNGKAYPLPSQQHVEYLHALIATKGGWFAPPKGSAMRPDKLRKSIPTPIRNLIKSERGHGKGSRLTIF